MIDVTQLRQWALAVDPELTRAIILIVVSAAVGLIAATVKGIPSFWRARTAEAAAREQDVYERIAREHAITDALAEIPEIRRELGDAVAQFCDRLKKLEHEIAPNGDPLDEGRTLRSIVRTQGSQLNVQTGIVEQISRRMGDGDRRFDELDKRIDRIEERQAS